MVVFPIGDDNTGRVRTPYVTYLFIALNVLVFVFLQGMGTNETDLGHGRFAGFYLLTGVLASVAHVVATFTLGDNPFFPAWGPPARSPRSSAAISSCIPTAACE